MAKCDVNTRDNLACTQLAPVDYVAIGILWLLTVWLAPGCWSERTEVHKAASEGHAAQLQQLIQSGASVNIVAVDSITPLHEACERGQTQCVRLLLDAGAQVRLSLS